MSGQKPNKKSYCQTPVLVLRLGVDFVSPLSQEEEEPPPNLSEGGVLEG